MQTLSFTRQLHTLERVKVIALPKLLHLQAE